MKAHDNVLINIHGLNMNGNHWQRPREFLPDRFDPEHPLSKTPSGEKRSPYAIAAFSGGRRICFGKSFAELSGKALLTMMTQRFDISFVNKDLLTAETPLMQIG